jgi:hypothetical protein
MFSSSAGIGNDSSKGPGSIIILIQIGAERSLVFCACADNIYGIMGIVCESL